MASSVEYHNCSKCPYKTRSKFTMKNHLKTHNLSKKANFDCANSIEPLKCSQCANNKTHNLAVLKRHFKAGHALLEPNEQKLYDCESCSFQTCSNLSSLCMKTREVKSEETIPEESEIGEENETDKNIFTCELCPYITENSGNYNRHVLNKHKQNGRILKCDHCSYETRYTHFLKRHIIMHHTDPEEIEWFNCEHCSYKGETESLLITHVSDHHSTESLKCEHCSFVTQFKRSLRTHMLLKHKEVDKIRLFQCAHCPYKSKSSDTLNSHVSHKHGQVESLKCGRCSFQTKYKHSLAKHVRTQHVRLCDQSGGASLIDRRTSNGFIASTVRS